MKPFNDISSVITEMQNALACAGRIFALLEEKEESADPAGTIDTVTGNVTIDDVAFSYDKEKKLIENFNLDVQPGMRVAIVGPTGCGKTTFINLLMRFYDVDAGKVCIDGKPIDELSRHALRSCFGMVLQDTWIKQGTVRDNISFGKPDATEEEIIKRPKRHTAGSLSSVCRRDLTRFSAKTASARGRNSFSVSPVSCSACRRC